LERLRALVDAILVGESGRVVFLAGPPGIGKTRLAHELGAYVRAHQGVFGEGRYLAVGNAPYGPWVHALRAALRGFSDGTARELLEPHRADLARLFPELGNETQPSSVLAPEVQRRRLYDSVAELLDQNIAALPTLVAAR
jgi:predicted ATPase